MIIRKIINYDPSKINEEKSINSTIYACADFITKTLLEIYPNYEKLITPILNVSYYYGKEELDLSSHLPNLGVVNFEFYVYLCNNKKEYNELLKQGIIDNSEVDYKSKYLRIVAVLINGKVPSDLSANLFHELTHLFQYEQGMEKRVDLYDKMISIINGNVPIEKKIIAHCLYYTFKHEQDAFVHQYFATLKDENFKGTFDESLQFSEYNNFCKVERNCNRIFMHDWDLYDATLRELEYDRHSFKNRIYFAKKRFLRKLKNAFTYYQECYNKGLFEQAYKIGSIAARYNLPCKIENYYNYEKIS